MRKFIINMDFITDNNPADFNYLRSVLEEHIPVLRNDKTASANKSDVQNEYGYASYPGDKELPIDTSNHAVLSKLYFETYKQDDTRIKAASVPYVQSRLEKSAEFFKLQEEFKLIEEIVSQLHEKSASMGHKKYALQYQENNTIKAFYPINDKEEVIESASRLGNDKHKMPYDWFKIAAQNIVKEAKNFKITQNYLPPQVKKAGLKKEASGQYLNIALASRLRIVDEESQELYKELFKSAQANIEQEPGKLDQVLPLIEDLDRTNRINYSSGVLDPYTATYSSVESDKLEKLASSTVFINDVGVPVTAFQAVPFEKLAARFSKSTAQKISEIQDQTRTEDAGKLYKISNELNSFDKSIRDEISELLIQQS